jgi:SAM-dependent methyltransferase
MKKNEWDPETGCCLLFGIYPAGTWAAVALLESPMRYRLPQQLLGKSTWYVWFRLIVDRLGLHRFTDLECDWVVVVKCDLLASGMFPGDPTVVLASKIPDIPNWDASARAELWHRVASSPGWTGVAGDEPDLSTHMILEWLSQFSFSGESLLDFGCGPGRLFEAYFRHGPPAGLVAMDIDQRMLQRAQSHFNLIDRASDVRFEARHGGAEDLRPFSKRKFTTVICWTVLNHILDDNECIETLRSLCNLARNRVIVCDPVCEESEQPVVSTGFPSKRRRLSFYVTVIRDEGFDVNASIQRFGSPGHPEAHRATILGERPRVEEADSG